MKRKRYEMEKKKTELQTAIEELSLVTITKPVDNTETTHIPLRPLLSFCNLIIQVLDRIGPTMAVLRQDIDQNIQRLEKLYETDHCGYSNLVEILNKERNEGTHKMVTSCSRALLWLTRLLSKEMSSKMEELVEECYMATLKPHHGWIASAAFKVCLKIVPDNKTFMDAIGARDQSYETLREEIDTLSSLLTPILKEISIVLEQYGLNRLKSM
ncbi:glycolipid transfer protein 2 isoform X2 [Raphanus sativus]|uniref:Glycolipid transfer protein 2 isoform X2 n=1 Tax=Raphanus sativus TaxID=3726 RepID=A0A9W3DQ43_RAPSA|nr:glycolipid transfer protein 2 isoform X2 [Raphanus sativus]